MPAPLFKALSGTVDGVNAVFSFGEAYTPGTVALYLNGQLLLDSAGNPWSETDPATGEVTITEAACIPGNHATVPDDELAGFALDISVTDPQDLVGQIEVLDVTGVVAPLDDLSGGITVLGVTGPILDLVAITGDTEPLSVTGTTEICP